MKRIICILIIFILCLSIFCGCSETTIIDNQEVEIIDNHFILIEGDKNHIHLIVYDKDTKVVYYIENGADSGYLTPYLIYEDGAIYGAVYKNNEITPAPFAFIVTEATFDSILDSAVG